MKSIQGFVQQVVETMATLLQVEITVVDVGLERIAGTGKYRSEIGTKIPKNFILGRCVETFQQFVVEDPRNNPICENCPSLNHCIEKAVIAFPIKSEDRVYGGMGLTAFDMKQRRILLANHSKLLAFMMNFSELICTKILENQLSQNVTIISEQLKSIIDTINEGIIVIDGQGKISFMNSYARKKIAPDIEYTMLGRNISQFLPHMTLDRLSSDSMNEYYESGFLAINGNPVPIVYSSSTVQIPNVKGGAIMFYHLSREASKLVKNISEVTRIVNFNDLLGISSAFLKTKLIASKAAQSDSTVLLLGESGTGKELFARAIHSSGDRKYKPFVAINCAAIPDTLVESELFGYEKGAFTGASKEGKLGKFELANQGTIFLDEIGDLPLSVQAKLLRVLEDRCIDRIGSTKLIQIDTRVVVATSRNLEKMIEEGEFRRDLYYRISAIPIQIPALRDRREDIVVYLDFFRKHFNLKLGKDARGFSDEALKILNEYDWPGNVREIKNTVEYAINMETEPLISVDNLPHRTRDARRFERKKKNRLFENEECQRIRHNLGIFGNTTAAKVLVAKELGISLATLYRKMKAYGIETK